MINIFMPSPDLTKPNPRYKCASPMLLFDIGRIEKIERTEKFKLEMEKAKRRKVSAKKAVETKLENMRKWLDSVQIEVPTYNRGKLINRACRHYNEMQEERELMGMSTSGMEAKTNSDPKFIERICVNYLRHCSTKYEEYLDDISGSVGFSDGYDEIRRKIFIKIAENNPWLSEECRRQQGDDMIDVDV